MENKRTLIACKIFEHELNSILTPDEGLSIHWIDAALHADADCMHAALKDAITLTRKENPNGLRFLFGSGCHPDMCKIAGECGAKLPPEKNCIHAIIGPERTKELEANRTMVITPGWLPAWSGIMEGLGWDAVDVRMNIGRYDRILLLDTGVVPVNDEEILIFYDLVQVPVEIEQVDLTYFRNLVHQLLYQETR